MRRVVLGILLAAWTAHVQAEAHASLRLWYPAVGHEGNAFARAAKASHENVVACHVDYTAYRSRLLTAADGDEAPDVFVLNASDLDEFVQARRLLPLDDLVTAEESADLFRPAWNATAFDRVHYGYPVDVRVLAMFCNTRLLRAHGCAPPTTRQELANTVSLMARPPAPMPFSLGWLRASVATILVQHGGAFWSEDGTRCTLNAPANVEGLAFCQELAQQGRAQRLPCGDAWLGLRKGKLACMFGESTLADKKDQVEVLPVPALGTRPATWADSRVLCLRAGLKDERKTQAWNLVCHLSDHAMEWLAPGELPARTSQLASSHVTDDPVSATLARQLPNAFYLPSSRHLLAEFDSAIDEVMLNNATPQSALDHATARVNTALQKH